MKHAVMFKAFLIFSVAALFVETVILKRRLPRLYTKSPISTNIPVAYGMVMFFNVIASCIVLKALAVRSMIARQLCKERAAQQGDKDAEQRFGYPNVYAEGFSEQAKLFNCVQRCHQHALETFTPYIVGSIIGGTQFPVTCCIGGLLWCVGRLVYSRSYSSGDPTRRHEYLISYGIYVGVMMQMMATIFTAAGILGCTWATLQAGLPFKLPSVFGER